VRMSVPKQFIQGFFYNFFSIIGGSKAPAGWDTVCKVAEYMRFGRGSTRRKGVSSKTKQNKKLIRVVQGEGRLTRDQHHNSDQVATLHAREQRHLCNFCAEGRVRERALWTPRHFYASRDATGRGGGRCWRWQGNGRRESARQRVRGMEADAIWDAKGAPETASKLTLEKMWLGVSRGVADGATAVRSVEDPFAEEVGTAPDASMDKTP
jgi:hypothetical protein